MGDISLRTGSPSVNRPVGYRTLFSGISIIWIVAREVPRGMTWGGAPETRRGSPSTTGRVSVRELRGQLMFLRDALEKLKFVCQRIQARIIGLLP